MQNLFDKCNFIVTVIFEIIQGLYYSFIWLSHCPVLKKIKKMFDFGS